MSTEVVWNVVKNHSAFMKKQKQGCKVTMFSTDKQNVLNAYRCVFPLAFDCTAPSTWESARSVLWV